jgi:uncharacterized flavoprotein (TIGR03862 family)
VNRTLQKSRRVAIVGSGPAGLAAAEALAGAAEVDVFEALPSPGRKFLLAGKSGLNVTHAEDFERFLTRFGPARATLEPALQALTPHAIRAWSGDLGIETFVGSSGRVFPTMMKASPLLRAWLARLAAAGVRIHTRHRWTGWNTLGELVFAAPGGPVTIAADATVFALGGASWPRLGSDGAWVTPFRHRGIEVHPLRPANCGFDVDWSAHFRERFAGIPVKSVELRFDGRCVRGDFVITRNGIEGSPIYTLSADLRDALECGAPVTLSVDLAPDRSAATLAAALLRPRGRASLANHLRKATRLSDVKLGLLRELLEPEVLQDPERLAAAIKGLPLTVQRTRPIAEAISSAGGIALGEFDEHFMLRKLPGVFAAGEMLDWEAPTGGYLLTACLATGRAAGLGAARWLDAAAPSR